MWCSWIKLYNVGCLEKVLSSVGGNISQSGAMEIVLAHRQIMDEATTALCNSLYNLLF